MRLVVQSVQVQLVDVLTAEACPTHLQHQKLYEAAGPTSGGGVVGLVKSGRESAKLLATATRDSL